MNKRGFTKSRFVNYYFHFFSGEKATKWETVEHCVDGLTTNGVLVMSPNGMFCPGHDPSNGDRNGGGAPTPDQVLLTSL